MKATRILEENLRAMCEHASFLVGYEFDDLDWDAVTVGLRGTDVEAQRWFEYPLCGRQQVTLRVALDPGSSVVFVGTDAEDDLRARLESATDLMAEYELRRPAFRNEVAAYRHWKRSSPGLGEAVALLIERCPELEPTWVHLRAEMGGEVGIYNVFGGVVLPALSALLTTTAVTDRFKDVVPARAIERSDLIGRLYEVLDGWAVSRSAAIQEAVVVELTVGGYGGVLTVPEMLAHAGPDLRALIEERLRKPFDELLTDH
jgi:hypothetical protein